MNVFLSHNTTTDEVLFGANHNQCVKDAKALWCDTPVKYYSFTLREELTAIFLNGCVQEARGAGASSIVFSMSDLKVVLSDMDVATDYSLKEVVPA